MRMKELCPDERPREKMLRHGVKALSNAEIIAILLGSGTEGKNAVDVARDLILSMDGQLSRLSHVSLERLVGQKGIGRTKALSLAAALELGRRTYEEDSISVKDTLTTPEAVFRLMLPLLRHLDHEECWVLFLNRAHLLIGKELLTSGSGDSTILDPQQILRKAIEKQAYGLILVHNHPSGSPLPGQADIRETERLKKAAGVMGFELLDHVIISDSAYFSFADEALVRL